MKSSLSLHLLAFSSAVSALAVVTVGMDGANDCSNGGDCVKEGLALFRLLLLLPIGVVVDVLWISISLFEACKFELACFS